MQLKSALALVALGIAATSALGDWPNFRGPSGDSSVGNVALKSISDAKELWKASLGDSFGQVSIAGGKAVAFIKRDDREVAIGLDATTGKELWLTPIDKTISDRQGGDGPRTTPAIDGNLGFIYSTYGKLFALDLTTGKEAWKQDIAAGDGRPMVSRIKWGNAASPVVVGDHVLVIGGGAGKGIIAFDKKTGKTAWSKTDDLLTHATPTVATIHGVQQVICFMQSGLVSVTPNNGEILWKYSHPYRSSTAASPVVGGKKGDIVYLSAGYGIGAAACKITKDGDKWTAEKLWRTEGQNSNHWATAVHHGGYIYGLFGQNDGKGPLGCLDIETGESKWAKPGVGSQGALILVGDNLLIQTPGGELILVEATPDKYKEIDRKKILSGKNWTMPAFSDGKIFARNTEQLVCLEPAK